MSEPNERQERIRQMAHRIWESEGCPQGQEERHWKMAERLIEASEATADKGSQPLGDPDKE